MVEGAKPLQVGDICHPEARIVSVTNSSKGKTVKVKGHCYRNNRGRFIDYKNTFDTTEEPDYLVHLESDADVGVLQKNGLSGMICHHCFWLALPLFSAFNPRSPSRTLPISTFLSPVISSEPTKGPHQGRLCGLPAG